MDRPNTVNNGSSSQSDRYILAVIYLVPAAWSSFVFLQSGSLYGTHLLFSLFLALSGIVFLLLSLSKIQAESWGRWLYRYLPMVCFMTAIFWISSLSLMADTKAFLPDYAYHTLEFTVFGYLGIRMFALNRSGPPTTASSIAALCFCISYAALDEVHQYYVPGRNASARDLAFDAAGILAGMILFYLIHLRPKTKRGKTLVVR